VGISRREFLKGSAGLATSSLIAARAVAAAARTSRIVRGPYGLLQPVADLETGLRLLRLPEGFSYRTFSWAGDRMAGGQHVPPNHDGMGVVHAERRGGDTIVTLIRNHESAHSEPILAPARYDTAIPPGQRFAPGGGTTTLRFSGREWLGAEASLGGTFYNCAGGTTPWGTWLTCEETFTDLTASGGRRHGYVFEVRRESAATTGKPIVDMGRMMHEAVAVDPATSFAYLTEDNPRCSGLYRFLPNDRSGVPGSYEKGGRLQAARVVGRPHADLMAPTVGDTYRLEWVDIDDPDANPGRMPAEFPGRQGLASGPFQAAWSKGALLISRGEGICHHKDRFYLVDTEGGTGPDGARGTGDGVVWEYVPRQEILRAIFVSGSAQVADNIDNITVSPRGGILLCEDGDRLADQGGPGTRLLGLTPEGDSFAFAQNMTVLTGAMIQGADKQVAPGDYRPREFAGACFDPAGTTLFVNLQIPGITFAIWGPWERGVL
jgi:secreted PhoX family phosphatase